MWIADLHADIGYDVMRKKKTQQHKDFFNTWHIEKWKKEKMGLICMASYFEGWEDWSYMQEMIMEVRKAIEACSDIELVQTKEDLLKKTKKIKAIMSVEGMCGVKKDVKACIRWMKEQGVQIASLCWNDENLLATGVRGNPYRGLQPMGYKVIEEMRSQKMIVDVSHANDTTFWDIMGIEDITLMASHSNVREVCHHPRNLAWKQIETLLDRGGLIGMNATPFFIHEQEDFQDISHLLSHIAYIKQKQGSVKGIACGFDFMDYYEEEYCGTKGLKDSSEVYYLVKALETQSYSDEEIKDIAYRNVVQFFSKHFA